MRIETAGVQSPGVCSSGYKGNTEGAPWVLPSLSQLALRDPSKAERPTKIKEKQKKEKKTKKDEDNTTQLSRKDLSKRTSQKGPYLSFTFPCQCHHGGLPGVRRVILRPRGLLPIHGNVDIYAARILEATALLLYSEAYCP